MTKASGFTLIEVCIALTVSVVMLYALHAGTRTAMSTRRTVESEYQVHLFASEFLSRLRRLPFGSPGAPPPTNSELSELFDADQNLGSVTLMQLRVAPGSEGYSFAIASQELRGTWRVRVTSDLNGDGDVADERENRSDLLRAEIHYRDRLRLETLRAAEAPMTLLDTNVDYLRDLPQPPSRGSAGGGGGGSGSGGGSNLGSQLNDPPPPNSGSGGGLGAGGGGANLGSGSGNNGKR